MKPFGLRLFLLIIVFGTLPLVSQQKRAITPEDIVNIRTVYDVSISPDGKRIAFVVSEPADSNKPQLPRDQNVWIVPTDGSQPARLFASTPKRENYPRWSPDGHWLAFLSNRSDDNLSQIWLMPADSGAAERVTSAKTGVVDYKWSPDGKMLAFLTRDDRTDEERKRLERRDDATVVDRDVKYQRLWAVGVKDRTPLLVTKQDFEVVDFDWSPDGESFAIAYTAVPGFLNDLNCSLAVVNRSDSKPVRNLTSTVSAAYQNVRWSPDGRVILFFERAPSGLPYWMSLIESKGGQARPLLKEFVGTFSACEWAPDSRHLIAQALVGSHGKLFQIDVGTGQVLSLADIMFRYTYLDVSADRRTLAFVGERVDSPRDVWSVTVGQPPRQLTNFNPQIASLKLGNVRDVSWTSRKDGQVLQGVLVTPPDFISGQPHPTVVEAHEGNSAWTFGWQGSYWQWAQLLASNGYVVFLPNVRGVTGQNWKFSELSHTYDGTAFRETMDGVDFLVEQKIADPDRLGIGGFSAGGSMAAWAITQTNRFKAAVPFAASVDHILQWGASDFGKILEVTFGGTPWRARRLYEANSPLNFAQNCKTPTLILHGANDTIVPIAQAYGFYRSLKAVGVETEMVVYPREGHGISERAHQIDFQKRLLAWFDKYLK